MNRKLLAAAVGAALAAPTAYAAPELYGRANLGLDQFSATGATAGTASDVKSRMRVFEQGSRFGVRGSEDLGGGLKVVYLMESGVNIDTGAQTNAAGAANSSTGYLNSRIGHVGLSGDFGLLTFGRSNIWWTSGSADLIGSTYINTGPGLPGGTLGRQMSVGVTRQSSTLQYTSPKLGGVAEVILSYSPNRAEVVQAGANVGGRVTGITVQGATGPISFGVDYVADQGNTAAATLKNTGTKVRGGYAYQPGGQVSLVYVSTTHNNDSGVAATAGPTGVVGIIDAVKASQSGLMLQLDHTAGNLGFMLGLQKISNAKDRNGAAVADTNMTGLSAGVRFLHSKTTWSYVSYNAYKNAANYNCDYNNGQYTSVATNTLQVGADPKVFAVGIMHNF